MPSNTNKFTAISLTISAGKPSSYYQAAEQEANGAHDYDVALTIGDVTTDGEITLYRGADGSMGTHGTPLEVWCGRSLIAAIDSIQGGIDGAAGQAVLGALSCLDDGDVTW